MKKQNTKNNDRILMGMLGICLSFVGINKAEALTLSLAGDSTVATYSTEKQGWGASISKYMKSSVSVKNFAAGGRTTKTFRSEGFWSKLLKSNPTFVFLQFAHNDSSSDKEKHVSISAYKGYLKKYIDESRKQKAEIFFVTPPHRCRFNGSKVSDELKPYVDAMKSVAKENDVGILDLYKRSGDFLNSQGESACKTYFVSGDRTHFNKKGSDKMASFVAAEAKLNADLASYVK